VEVPQIDHQGPVPPYQQIAEWLRQQIIAGELRPGQVIPSEKDLVDLFGVARTVRTVPQRGTYVTSPE
jgi:DNA-binding GntR family transcriptional regulator